MLRLPRRSSLAMLFLVVLICALLPLLTIYFSAHTHNVSYLRNEVISSLQRQNQDFSDRLMGDISRIISTNQMLSENWELGKLAIVPDEFTSFQKAQAFSNITDKIYLTQVNSRFIESISVYFPGIDKCLSSDSSSHKLTEMRSIASQAEDICTDRFFIQNGELQLISENTFSSGSTVPSMIVQTTLSERELVTFYQDRYWNELSQGAVMSLHSMDWPETISPDSLEAVFYRELSDYLSGRDEVLQSGQLTVPVNGRTYQLIFSYVPNAELILLRYFDEAQIGTSMGFSRAMLVLFAAVAAFSFAMIYYFIYRLVNRPLKTLLKGFARVEAGELDFDLKADTRGEFAYVFDGFSSMLAKLRVLMQQTYLQGQLVRKSEFKQLQAQIDPHFLYNGFFILNKRIRAGDTEGALEFSKLLSDYFRYVTQNARDAVQLAEEVAHAYNYAHIQQIRFANRLALTLDPVPEAFSQLLIPRLVLQPIVENVFRHVLEAAEELTHLHISYHDEGENIAIWIEDSGSFMTEEKLDVMRRALLHEDNEKEIHGLTNVHKRLQLYYGEQFGLFYGISAMGGLLVRIIIPKKGRAAHETHSAG